MDFRMLAVNRLSLFGTNHQPLSISYIVIDQNPFTDGVSPCLAASNRLPGTSPILAMRASIGASSAAGGAELPMSFAIMPK